MDSPFLSPEPIVRVVNAFSRPLDNAIATARTCYSSRGIVTAEQVAGDDQPAETREKRTKRRDSLAKSLYLAGHHTTLQHATFQFSMENVSRQFLWTFLHSHPFYNSEQVSQRYVTVKPGAVLVPPLEGEALSLYRRTVERQIADYAELIDRLTPAVGDAYGERFRSRRRTKRGASDIKKRAQEIARYVLPVATFAYLYHTVSALTVLRYHRLADQMDAPAETRLVVGRMVEEILRIDPDFAVVLEEPLSLEETPEAEFLAAFGGPSPEDGRAFREEFDAELDGRVSRLVATKDGNEAILAQAVREVFGLPRSRMSDDDAIAAVLDPARNRLHGESLNVHTHSKLSRCMLHPSWTFRKRISHTADSQDQRHRMTPGSRPALTAYLTDEPDVVEPLLLERCDGARTRFRESVDSTWEAVARLRAMGVPDEMAAYLLPNAVAIRFSESADLLNLAHKLKMRLCYNAQEEIWRASVDEAEQVAEADPRIGAWLLPPCSVRHAAGRKPVCPEGPRFCGVRVWQLPRSEYVRSI